MRNYSFFVLRNVNGLNTPFNLLMFACFNERVLPPVKDHKKEDVLTYPQT